MTVGFSKKEFKNHKGVSGLKYYLIIMYLRKHMQTFVNQWENIPKEFLKQWENIPIELLKLLILWENIPIKFL